MKFLHQATDGRDQIGDLLFLGFAAQSQIPGNAARNVLRYKFTYFGKLIKLDGFAAL